MKPFDRDQLSALLAPHRAPCVTICMSVSGRPPESKGDAVQYGNLLRKVRTALEGHGEDGRAVLARLEDLGNGGGNGDASGASPRSFWNSGLKGLAVFASPDHFSWFRVAIPLAETTQIGDSFHVKPLLPLLFDDVRFHVLALSQHDVRLYEGSATAFHELPMDGIPRNMAQAVGREFDDAHQGASFHGSPDHHKGRTGGTGAPGATGTHSHGYGGADKELDKDLERFLREVDRGVVAKLGAGASVPLVVVAVDKQLAHYRQLSKHPNVQPEGIAHDPASMTPSDMHQRAAALFQGARDARLSEALDAHGASASRGQGGSDLSEIARAAVEGRVGRLLLEKGREAWGRIDRGTGELTHGSATGTGSGSVRGSGDADLYDELAELTLLKGGDVMLVEPGGTKTPTGVAAVYRY